MINLKKILIFVALPFMICFCIIFNNAYSIPKKQTALVDVDKTYWNYNKTLREKKRLEEMKQEMIRNIQPSVNSLKQTKSMLNSGAYSPKVKYEYMQEYFLISSEINKKVDEYNKQLLALENEIRENLMLDIWSSVKIYSKLNDYKYVFKIGKEDVIAYDKDLDITSDIISFINTIPNASELKTIGEALVTKSNTRLITGKRPENISLGSWVKVLYDPYNVLDANSNDKTFTYEYNNYNVTVMVDGKIGLVPVENLTMNIKSEQIDLGLEGYTAYIGYNNYIKSDRIENSSDYELKVIKIPRLYIEKSGSASFKSLDIQENLLEHVEVIEIDDVDHDGNVEIIIHYTNNRGTFLKFIHVYIEEYSGRERVKIYNVSPRMDFEIEDSTEPRSSRMPGKRLITQTYGGRYFKVENGDTLVFTQIETEYRIKNNHTQEVNPYEYIKPEKKIIKYKFNPTNQNVNSRKRYDTVDDIKTEYIERGFTRAYAPVYAKLGDIDHIAELRKNDTYMVHSATSHKSNLVDSNNDLWLKIILEGSFNSKNELKDAGFPLNSNDAMYLSYESSSSGNINIRYYAYIYGGRLNLMGLVQYLGLPYGIY